MSYWKRSEGKSYTSLDNFGGSSGNLGAAVGEFYEYEAAIVLDVILDENHEIFKNKNYPKIDIDRWQSNVSGEKPSKDEPDLSWIGRALVRPITSQRGVEKEKLTWAIPLEGNISEYPLVNEYVAIAKYLDKVFYTKKINVNNLVNTNADFCAEILYGGFKVGEEKKGNRELNKPSEEYKGPLSKTRMSGGSGWQGALGRYFSLNKNVRGIKRFEGDTVIESRFGQSIRFSAYDNDNKKDVGNPMILIRNGQRSLLPVGQSRKDDPLPTISGTESEKNTGGYLEENINYDGSSIHITSGNTISKWVTSCYKKMFSEGMEEVGAFSPEGCSTFKYPTLDGDQVVINTDRLILSARWGEQFQYSKQRFGIVTDSEYTVDAHDQIVFTTNKKTTLNSPVIFLGEYNQTSEPAMLGQTTISWLYALCNWLLKHVHDYDHSHPGAGKPSPEITQTPIPDHIKELIALRDTLHSLLSRRVFLTGGGYAPGQDGAII
jgi:hypothetical protein